MLGRQRLAKTIIFWCVFHRCQWRQLKLHQSQFSTPLVPTQVPPVPVFKIPCANSSSPSPCFQDPWRQLKLELAPGILKTGTAGTWVGARDLENWDWGSLSWRQGSWKLGLGELELAPGILKTGTGGAWVGARDLENWDWGSLSWRQGSWKLGLGELELAPGILKTGTGGAWVGARDLENWDWGSLSWRQGSWKLGLGELELGPGILKTGTGGPNFQDPWRQPRLSQSQFSRSPGWNFWKFTKNYSQFSAKFDKKKWEMWSVDNIFQFFLSSLGAFFRGKKLFGGFITIIFDQNLEKTWSPDHIFSRLTVKICDRSARFFAKFAKKKTFHIEHIFHLGIVGTEGSTNWGTQPTCRWELWDWRGHSMRNFKGLKLSSLPVI